MKTITSQEVETLANFGKNESIISPNEANTIIDLTKTKKTTRKVHGNSTVTTERILTEANVNLDDFSIHLLDKLITIQKRKIEKFKDQNPTLLLKDETSFESELRREKIFNWIFFVLALIIIPVLIILMLCLFAPAVIPCIGHFLYVCLDSGEAAIAGVTIAMCSVFIPTGLYFGLVCMIHFGIEAILGKRIFTEKSDIAELATQLASEEELYSKLMNNKADRQAENVLEISESTHKNRSPNSVHINSNLYFFPSGPNDQDPRKAQQQTSPQEKLAAETLGHTSCKLGRSFSQTEMNQ